VRAYAKTISQLDLRSLAVMRMGLGIVLLVDLAIRATDLTAMYTDGGVLPRADRVTIYGARVAYSAYDLVAASPTLVALAFGVVALAAVAMILGVFTRAAVLVCWLSTLSLYIRMPLVSTGGDLLLMALLLWSAFLPLDARWSLAARRRPTSATRVSNLASFALLLQVGVLFSFAGGAKLMNASWRAGDGVYYALTAEFYTTSIASWMLDVSPGWLLAALTYAVVAYELLCPVLLLVPRRMALWRGIFVAATIGMNLMFWFCLRIGIFSWVAMLGCVAIIPGALWDRLERRFASAPPAGGDLDARLRRPATIALAALLALMMLNNLQVPRLLGVKRPMARLSTQVGLAQRGWPMFSPTARDQGWFVLLTRLADGRTVDLYRDGAPPRWQRPARISAEFATYRRRKYFMNLKRRNPRAAALLLRYQCRRWNRDHHDSDRAQQIRLVYMRDVTMPHDKRSKPERVVLAMVRCQP